MGIPRQPLASPFTCVRHLLCITAALSLLFTSQTLLAQEKGEFISRQVIQSAVLNNIEGHKLVSIIVNLEPGAVAPPHVHGGFVFVYVLEGVVQSQLDDGEVLEYQTADSWIEPAGVVHTLTRNPSTEDPAKILAVFVAGAHAELTSSP